MRSWFSVALLVIVAWAGAGLCAVPPPPRHWSDGNIHYVDFFQHSEGMAALLAALDANHIDEAMISGMPITKLWDEQAPRRPRYSLGDGAPLYWYSATDVLVARAVLALPADQQKRLHPFICGFNPQDRFAVEHIERMLDWYPGLWQGIGEILTHHDELSALTYGTVARPNSKALDRVYELAARHNLPVLLHCNVTSPAERKLIYLGELEKALARHPDTRFIWAHAGTSQNLNRRHHLDRLLPALTKLLTEFDNLWIDLSWSVCDEYLLRPDGSPDPDWLELLQQFPRRFMVGSDAVGKFGSLGAKLKKFAPILDALPPKQAELIARSNFLALLP